MRSIVYFVLTVGLEMTLGHRASRCCVHSMVWGKNLVTSLMLMPMFMAPAIVGLLGRFLTDSTYGLYAWVLRETGLYTGDILGSTTSAFLAVTLMDVWEWTPLIALIVLAGLASLPKPVIEAARVDGATYLQRLRHIVLPDDRRRVIVALLMRSMDAIRYFDIIHNTTNGGPGGRDEDRPDPALRDGLPLLRPRLRGGDRPVDAGGLDPAREPVHARTEEAGAGEMKGGADRLEDAAGRGAAVDASCRCCGC